MKDLPPVRAHVFVLLIINDNAIIILTISVSKETFIMIRNLKQYFEQYLLTAEKYIKHSSKTKRKNGLLKLISNEAIELKERVNKAESHKHFIDLITQTEKFLKDRESLCHAIWNTIDESLDSVVCRDVAIIFAIQNYFRRSGYYYNLFLDKETETDEVFENFHNALMGKEIDYSYLIPLHNVFFDAPIDFQDFKITKFTEIELKTILNNEVNDIFYPWASSEFTSITDCWFLYTRVKSSRKTQDYWYGEIDFELPYKGKVGSILKLLSLFDWHLGKDVSGAEVLVSLGIVDDKDYTKIKIEGLNTRFLPVVIPYVIETNDDLLSFPSKVPFAPLPDIISYVKTKGLIMNEDSEYFEYRFDSEQNKQFEKLITQSHKTINRLNEKNNKYDFIERALTYLMKAFFSKGTEHLLWHITALESLLGDKGAVRNKLAQRIATILCDTNTKKDYLKSKVKELYDFRSDLVHGNRFQKKVYDEHISLYRHLDRKVILWFIHCVDYLDRLDIYKEKNFPTQGDILILLDLDQRRDIFIKDIVAALPKGFPCVTKWVQ